MEEGARHTQQWEGRSARTAQLDSPAVAPTRRETAAALESTRERRGLEELDTGLLPSSRELREPGLPPQLSSRTPPQPMRQPCSLE